MKKERDMEANATNEAGLSVEDKVESLFRYMGGKRKTRERLVNLMKRGFNAYFEPFIGAANLYLEVWSQGFRGPAFLGDYNPEIANVHLVVKANPKGFLKEYSAHALNDSKAYFGKVRDADASAWSPAARAARTVYLAKAGYCGLLKTKRDGGLSVTYGDGRPGNVRLDHARVHTVTKAFWSATICHADFEWVTPLARKGDLVVADPPYAESNDRYTAAGFGPDDQRRLARMCRTLDERGAFFLQTNSDCALIRGLYGQYHLIAVPPRPSLRCDGTSKQPMGEVVVTNYIPPAGAMRDLDKAA